jgi:hypothetical protein
VVYFDIGKQKVVWILKHKEQHKEAAGGCSNDESGENEKRGVGVGVGVKKRHDIRI